MGISNLDTLNPLISKNQNIQDISKLIYEPLFYLTNDYKLENALAIECSKTAINSYLVKLRENVKWHNGNSFIAADVKYTIEQIQKLGSDYIYYANVQNIESVEVISDSILRINVLEEKPFFEYDLTFPIICMTFFGIEDISVSQKSNIPMGTGIYKLQSVDINSQIELKINDNWWNITNKKPKLEKVNIKIFSSQSEVYNAYKLGSIDLLCTRNNSNIEKNIGTIGYNIKELYGREYDYLALNCSSDVLSNKEIRQALKYAIDKQRIINEIYNGKYFEADYPLSYGSYLYNSSNSNYEFNQEKSKKILQDNEWNYTNKNWQKKIGNNTVKIKIKLLVNSLNENRVKAANIIKENLESIGIPVSIISVKDNAYNNYVTNKNYDLFFTGITVRN